MATDEIPANKAACPQCGKTIGIDDFPDNKFAEFVAKAFPISLAALSVLLVFRYGLLLDMACIGVLLVPAMLLFAIVTGYRCRECHVKVPGSALEPPQKKSLLMRRLAHVGTAAGLIAVSVSLGAISLVLLASDAWRGIEHEFETEQARYEDDPMSFEDDGPDAWREQARRVESDINRRQNQMTSDGLPGLPFDPDQMPGSDNPFGDDAEQSVMVGGPSIGDTANWLSPDQVSSKPQVTTPDEVALDKLDSASLAAKLNTDNSGRRMRIIAILASRGREGVQVMIDVLNDPKSPAVKEVLIALGQMGDRSKPALVAVAQLAVAPQTDLAIRREALRTLSQIDPDKANNLTFTLVGRRDQAVSEMAAEELKRQVRLGQTGSVSQWVRALGNDDLRDLAVAAIKPNVDQAEPVLLRTMNTADVGSPEALAVTRLLMTMKQPPGGEKVIANLVHLYESPTNGDITEKLWVMRQFGRIGPEAAPVAGLMIDALDNISLRDEAEESLAAVGTGVLPEVIKRLGEDRYDRDASLIRVISGCGKGKQVDLLLPLLKDSDARRRASGAAAIGALGGNWPEIEKAVPALAEQLDDRNSMAKRAAARAIAQLGAASASAGDALVEMLVSDPMYSEAAITLVAVGKAGAADTIVPKLAEALSNNSASVRIRAARVLGQLGDQAAAAVPQLITLVSDPQADCRNAAINALGAIGPAASDALPALREAEQNSDTSAAAKEAITAITGN